MIRGWRRGGTAVVLVFVGACRPPGPAPVVEVLADVTRPPATAPPVAAEAAGPVVAVMRNVHFRLDPILALDVRHLVGELRPTRPGAPVDFDRPDSFGVWLADAEASVDTLSLGRLMNRYVFRSPHPPLSDLHFASRDSLIQVRGMLHSGVGIPFTILASVSVTDKGLIRLHPVDVNVGPVDVDWFRHLFGIKLQEVISTKGAVGLTIHGDDLLVDPTAPLPPPAMHGRLRSAAVIPAGLLLRFIDAAMAARLTPPPSPPVAAPNYMYFRGGLLHFGKLFMPAADMEVVDSGPGRQFDFFLDQYQRQLEAGRAQVRADYGLYIVMPGYDRLLDRAARP